MMTRLPLLNRPTKSLLGRLAPCVLLAILTVMPSTCFAQALVSNQTVARLGLERSWFAQVRVDPARHKVVHWLLDEGQLFALTSAGSIQSIDSETGKTLWTIEVGLGQAPSAGMAVNSKYVALLGAARLYLMDRADGHHLWSRPVGGAASSAPALSNNYAYVTLMNGLVEGYRLDDSSASVWQYQSHGRTFQSPTITGKVVSWPSDSGKLYVGQAEPPRVLFRVETNDEIVAAPAELDPYLYVGSLDGYLYCFHELTGSEQWRYATGFAITSQPAIVGEKAFVASEGPSLHAVNAITGQPLWAVDGAKQFVALGQKHTYGMDRYGTLVIIDNKSGSITGRLATGQGNSAIVNDKSDRIYLINDRGLVQCLHEIGAKEPTWHRVSMQQEDEMGSEDAKEDLQGSGTKESEPAAEDPVTEDPAESPFEIEDVESDPEDSNPFGF